jgi:hypothetical protein
MDLDPVNFSDEKFEGYIKIQPNMDTGDGAAAGSSSKRKTKNFEVNTDELFYMDAETNTKFKKKETQVSTDMVDSFLNKSFYRISVDDFD